MSKHEDLTQQYSTWGDKLLQHTDVLHDIQVHKTFRPITIQLAPLEACDSDCPFCSVAARPTKSYMPFADVKQTLDDFKELGAKAVEITGGGNPMLYRDRETKENINDIVEYAHSLSYDIGIITNSNSLKRLKPENFDKVTWIRISLIKLDEGVDPEDYDFCGFPYSKLGFSYIIYGDINNPHAHSKREYQGTTPETITRIAELVGLHPEIKFVRLAGNCLIKGNNAEVRDGFKAVVDNVDQHNKFFIKDIGEDDGPFDDGCYVGLVRPYIAPHPDGGDYQVYVCTSHVLNTRTYDMDYSLCSIRDIVSTWERLSENYAKTGFPYEVKGNGGGSWCSTCKYCYYKFNNKLLHTVAQPMPDKNFA